MPLRTCRRVELLYLVYAPQTPSHAPDSDFGYRCSNKFNNAQCFVVTPSCRFLFIELRSELQELDIRWRALTD